MKWALLESIAKVLSKIIQKWIGIVSTTIAHSFFATLVIGIIRILISGIAVWKYKVPVFVEKHLVFGAIGFGIGAVIASVLSFSVFILGGDVGVNTFIVTLAIVPGAFVDRIFFNHSISVRAWCGVGVAILAGYVVLGMPTLTELAHLPMWVGLSFGAMFAVTGNQVITQMIKDINPMVKNFWGGITEVILCTAILFLIDPVVFKNGWSVGEGNLALGAAICGVIGVAMWSFNVLAYKGGAWIALKKLVMNASYLTMAMIAGIVLFGEDASVTKFAGVALYLVAFVLIDDKTWKAFTGRHNHV